MSALLVALSCLPGLAVIAWHLRERQKLRAFQSACDEERRETRLTYLADDEVTEKRASFSGYPFAKRHR
ncbi:MAG: hypothetical protein H0U66_09695 [Gemmatimonadaceae bacterium]|nr:hypothetical protein [Gemmatimonadaceae bacterium]